MSPTINLNRKSLALLIAIVCSGSAQGEEYYFDPALLQGATYGQNIARFNEQQTPSGDYLADVYVNGTLVTSSTNIRFNAVKEGQQTEPCLPLSVMKAAQIKSLPATDAATECRPLREWVPHAGWQFDSATLRLLLTIPMTELTHKPRGYISPSEWDSGALALFLRHNTNWTHTENTDSHYRYQYLWSGLNMGVNLGLWQVRHQSNLRYANSNQSGSAWRYNSVRTWVQRPVASINSILSLGDSYTDSSLFGSLSFNGVKLVTDERMRPQGKRGYAPEFRGVAASSAHVVVKQLGKVIYETNVPPGPFYIDDLYNTRYQGDLEVEVIEASGKTSRFTVPYSSVPDSVRPGNWHYSLAFGRVRQYYDIENRFFEGTFQHGVNNTITLNLGSRIAQRYQAWLAGGVWATGMGAFGLNATWSNARAEHNDRQQGWRAELSYSKTFTTGTNLVLAAYRYSTNGFRDLQDVLGVRREAKTGIDYYSDTLHQRNRLSATVSQPLGRLGTLNLSASTADYYNNQSRITQLQMGYSNQWRNISYGVNIARQRTTWDYDRFYHGVNEPLDVSSRQKYTETTMSFNVSIPLDWGENRTSVAMNYNQSSQSRSSTVSMTGSSGENSDLSWSVYGGYERYRNSNSDSSAPTTFGGNLQQNTRFGALRANYDQCDNYRQEGLGASGTLVLHPGGLTAGPYTSDTFALIHADGAQGAIVQNGQGAVVDRFGYAILPSLSPYRVNNVTLDTRKMRSDAELTGGSQQIVPYAGAIARVNFATISGKAVLISVKMPDDGIPPMGADVFNGEGTNIGMVGQSGQIYARIAHPSGSLLVRWGTGANQRCRVAYQLDLHTKEPFLYLNKICEKE
ncbi:fimbrial outer membrane usher protein [Salmonella enterica]|nr:fimbrial outer membrane usher protein [Salmonella enterica]